MAAHRTWTDDQLKEAVRTSATVAETTRKLNLSKSSGAYRTLVTHFKRLGLNADHFIGRGWAKGRVLGGSARLLPLDQVLVKGRTTNSARLRERLIRLGLKKAECEWCGLKEWRGKPAPLQLDHKDGDDSNNELANLRILCANCHAQTPTYCKRNKRSVKLKQTEGDSCAGGGMADAPGLDPGG